MYIFDFSLFEPPNGPKTGKDGFPFFLHFANMYRSAWLRRGAEKPPILSEDTTQLAHIVDGGRPADITESGGGKMAGGVQ